MSLLLPLERPAAQRIRIPELTCVCGEFEVVEEAQVRARAHARPELRLLARDFRPEKRRRLFFSLSLQLKLSRNSAAAMINRRLFHRHR